MSKPTAVTESQSSGPGLSLENGYEVFREYARGNWLQPMAVRLIMLSASSLAYSGITAAAGDLDRGATVYQETCIACHGSDGSGSLPGVPDLAAKTGPLSQDDAVLLKRMADGFQSPGSPMGMPPRGGDPALTDADLEAVLKYMRKELQQTR